MYIDIYLMDHNGYAGVIFKHKDQKNFYSIEVSTASFRIRKVFKNEPSLVKESKQHKCKKKKWCRLKIDFDYNSVGVFVNNNKQRFIKVFNNVETKDIQINPDFE